MEFNYSIIVPHKNTPELLVRCLDSIPRRTDIQIIIVDDNSDNIYYDNFPGINDKNIEIVFTKEGKGAGYARNVGISKAKGNWLLFCDADDFFIKDCFNNIIDPYLQSTADIIYFKANSIFSDTGEKATRHYNINKLINNFKKEDLKSEERLRYNFVNPICKLIRLDLIKKHNILFDEVIYSNDIMFSLISGYYAKSILAEHSPIYCITVSRGSLVNRKTKESVLCRYQVNLRKNQFLRSIGQSKYQVSIMSHLIFSLKKDPVFFIKLLKLMFKYKANPFTGYNRWFYTTCKIVKEKKNKKKYIIYD